MPTEIIVPDYYDIVIIDGIRFSRELLVQMTRPDPEVWTSLRRDDDSVIAIQGRERVIDPLGKR